MITEAFETLNTAKDIVSLPVLLWIAYMLWHINNRVTVIETQMKFIKKEVTE